MKTLRFSPLSGKAIAQIQADGRARTREDVQQLYRQLAAAKYHVKTHEIITIKEGKEGDGKGDKEYPIEFVLDVGITSETDSHIELPPPPESDGDTDGDNPDEIPATDKSDAATTDNDTAAKAGEE